MLFSVISRGDFQLRHTSVVSFGFSLTQSKCSSNLWTLSQRVLITIRNLIFAPELGSNFIAPVRPLERDFVGKNCYYCP